MSEMSTNYEIYLKELLQEIEEGGSRSFAIDRILTKIMSHRGVDTSQDLLLALSDASKNDESMFSIVHAAEDAIDSEYVRDLLLIFERMNRKSPRWASIVLMRALNNASTQNELVKQLESASEKTREALLEVCNRINSVSSTFLVKTQPIIFAASRH